MLTDVVATAVPTDIVPATPVTDAFAAPVADTVPGEPVALTPVTDTL